MHLFKAKHFKAKYTFKGNKDFVKIELYPFTYLDERKPRLPRKSSNGYKLNSDTEEFFQKTLGNLNWSLLENLKFRVEIVIFKGSDSLGKADLDNYCKALLDGITKTQKVWVDDSQVDHLLIERHYVDEESSWISLKVKRVVTKSAF
ncbi:RusA family crossover junction endodeoxyribonuclease [Reichenbachiella agariperforans]|uniref:RusA family crossover junction endodeoxyribonuclease n=1 Tax=Reichenbachiella agariperforans TaxID=156994 RepID=UPI001C099ED7|nr:RusA family crossover junction endodeoxyribonuclease [Reichenbachiella agariperforans]MBU2915957.1 RusA family crossover junction endodeoxyribonuclease [Reichenbachiella agariperforans]